MRLQYRLIPLTGSRVLLETILDSISSGTCEFASMNDATHYAEKVLEVRGIAVAWRPEVLDVVCTQTAEIES